MSRRVDRALGVKPYRIPTVRMAPRKRGLTLFGALKIMLLVLAIAGAGRLLYETSHCVQGVRCAD